MTPIAEIPTEQIEDAADPGPERAERDLSDERDPQVVDLRHVIQRQEAPHHPTCRTDQRHQISDNGRAKGLARLHIPILCRPSGEVEGTGTWFACPCTYASGPFR